MGINEDILNRITKALMSLKISRKNSLSLKSKYNTNVKSVLLYGREICDVNKFNMKKRSNFCAQILSKDFKNEIVP